MRVPKSALAGRRQNRSVAGRRHKQVNVLAASMLTPGDIETIKGWIEAFGLRPVVLPDLGDSLDGHLTDREFSPLTVGGTPKSEIEALGEAVHCIHFCVLGCGQSPVCRKSRRG